MTKLDVFAHVLPAELLNKMQQQVPNIVAQNPFVQIPSLTDMAIRHQNFPTDVKQIISNVNLNPEDYFDGPVAAELCYQANDEMLKMVADNNDIFENAVAMVPMNNIDQALEIITKQVAADNKFVGIQLFTRALGKSIADPDFEAVFAKMSELNLPIWLHPVFDARKPDNNITFSWEYELTQAMYQIVKAGYFEKYPNLKIIVHHAGSMVPFFAERIKFTMSEVEYNDFKKFYVDTAILGNPKALELALDFYGKEHILFGTDAPFAKMPNGATSEIVSAIDQMEIDEATRSDIYTDNFKNLLKK
ncbi:amidohydrolase family protein [Companilactobacillus kimchiensis]|uniref:Aminocarboxymuconate-semialdehyde decarboxylase n=1 Tax=Companilactobacillus kimchiensis TaxID=993692 RepID=A0A0R2LB58_9LACO|nr:amidohydrolase family protein [Companilactobacillus kimchiensis]KRN99122.1 aminocarboxymuconate-semialdehyde decarboxylase [Companilactobacillus kimchiensis]